jgi:hypothetical protein
MLVINKPLIELTSHISTQSYRATIKKTISSPSWTSAAKGERV